MGFTKQFKALRTKTKVIIIGILLFLFLVIFYVGRYFYLWEMGVFDENDPLWMKVAVTSGLADLSKEWVEY